VTAEGTFDVHRDWARRAQLWRRPQEGGGSLWEILLLADASGAPPEVVGTFDPSSLYWAGGNDAAIEHFGRKLSEVYELSEPRAMEPGATGSGPIVEWNLLPRPTIPDVPHRRQIPDVSEPVDAPNEDPVD